METTKKSAGGVGNGRKQIIVSSTSSDSHTWNLVYLQMLIEEHGFDVINLGACVPHHELVAACLHHRPAALVLSSVNGHGHIEGRQIIRDLRRSPQLDGMKAVVGGKLGIRGTDNADFTPALLANGFNEVFVAESGIEPFIHFLSEVAGAADLVPAEMAA